ncbi:MAG TPA: asparaginase [Arcobacter sp.]|nr:asparaginase [Arcobacter sp.]
MTKKLQIINTGGTFNKIYIPLKGRLDVSNTNNAIKNIFKNVYKTNFTPSVDAIIHKDSLDITKDDRKILAKSIINSKAKRIIIIHGTDTMNKTAKYLSTRIKNKKVVLIGAMQPFSYEPIEATASLMMAIGFLNSKVKNNIYICMNGLINKHNKIQKNYKKGVFECQ